MEILIEKSKLAEQDVQEQQGIRLLRDMRRRKLNTTMAMTNEEYKKLASKCRVSIHSDGGHFTAVEVYHAKTGFTYKVRREEVDTDSSWLATKMLLDKLCERLEGKI